MFRILSLLILSLALAPSALALERPILVEWAAYTAPPGTTVAGFKLYKEGALACPQFSGPAIVKGECTVELTKVQTPFTLTAVFTGGGESPHSAPYTLTDYGVAPPPGGVKVTVLTIRTTSRKTAAGNVIASTTMTSEEVPPDKVIKEGVLPGYRNDKGEWVSRTVIALR